MKVGIVGGGVSGLAAARTLARAGHDVTLYESSDAVGGRCATQHLAGYTFDTGVTSIAPRGRSIEPYILGELDQTDLVHIELPIYVHSGARISPGDLGKGKIDRYTYRSGNAHLGAILAEGLDVRLNSTVARFRRVDQGFELSGDHFDALVLTPPTPQTEQLLTASGERRSLGQATYRPCLSVLLGYELPPPAGAYHALIEPEQRHPLTWLSLESVKCPDRAPQGCTALVAQMSPSYSRQNFDLGSPRIIEDASAFIARLYGSAWQTPAVSAVKRWKYSLPESLALFESVNPRESNLVVAGDALLGGRVEYAFETGVWAARLLMGEPLVGK